MTIEQQKLKEKIDQYFDKFCNETNYVNRLGQENNWDFIYTIRVIEEYKKFLFVYALDKKPISPPHPIDEAWHIHILYTKKYFEELTPILGKVLHHEPESGKKEENEITKLKNWYDSTINRYRNLFGKEPSDIWTVVKKMNYSIPDKAKKKPVLYVNIPVIVLFIVITLLLSVNGFLWLAIFTFFGALIYTAVSQENKKKKQEEKNRYEKTLKNVQKEQSKNMNNSNNTLTKKDEWVQSYLAMNSIKNTESNKKKSSNNKTSQSNCTSHSCVSSESNFSCFSCSSSHSSSSFGGGDFGGSGGGGSSCSSCSSGGSSCGSSCGGSD